MTTPDTSNRRLARGCGRVWLACWVGLALMLSACTSTSHSIAPGPTGGTIPATGRSNVFPASLSDGVVATSPSTAYPGNGDTRPSDAQPRDYFKVTT
jgi:hypothetical protein